MMQTIRSLAARGAVSITLHARMEMDDDRVTTDALMKAIADRTSEIIEDYPDDARGHSHLVLAWTRRDEPIHVCCAIHEGELVVITVYRPNAAFWAADWRTRL